MNYTITKKVIVIFIVTLLILSGCKIDKYKVEKFDTWEEAVEITMKTLKVRYPDDEFIVHVDEEGEESVKKTDYGTAKVVTMYVESQKYDGCYFPTYIKNNGEYKDAYASCFYHEDAESMFDYIIEDQDNIIDYDVEIMSNSYNEIYDTENNTVYDYLKDTNSSTIFTIEVEDGTLDESIYELGEYAIGEIDNLGIRTTINLIIIDNGKSINLYAPMSGHGKDSIYHAKEYYYKSFRDANYINGYLGNVENEFKTVAEGKEVMFKVLSERYTDDTFEYVSEDFYKDNEQKSDNLYFDMKSLKYNGCEFEVYLDSDGSYYDSYLGCAFQEEILHFYDGLAENDNKVLSYWGSSPNRQYYSYLENKSFLELVEINLESNISIAVDLNIEIADGTSNEEVYEIIKRYIEKMNEENTVGYLVIYVNKNGENQKIYGYRAINGVNGYFFSEDQVYENLKENGYENGLN